jgi:hypothetical protein
MRVVQIQTILTSPPHLVRRFIGFLTARPLSPHEQAFVSESLSPDLQRLFYTQRFEDQRHAFDVASRAFDNPEMVEAALLHDIGKTATQLGAFGRALATMWAATSLPIWGNWSTYLDHGRIGAELIEANGGSELPVAFARHHPGKRPPSIDAAHWASLARADEI